MGNLKSLRLSLAWSESEPVLSSRRLARYAQEKDATLDSEKV
ncbi:MAG: hypothetical protein N2V75_04585 [Methanophagales archaeon]|nr:hypothetical protein [Methanophagales archaeon]